MNTTELYTQWLEKATADPDLQAELQAIAGQDEEIRDRFYRSLEFGTAGLRGVIGAGTNRMNVYTVGPCHPRAGRLSERQIRPPVRGHRL